MPNLMPATEDRQTLASRLDDARSKTDEIFSLLTPEALYDRPIPERHRLVFYLGHVEAFDWNLIARRTFELDSFHPDFDKLFAFGIDPIDGGLPNEPASDWPEARAVRSYNERVRSTVDECLKGAHKPRSGADLETIFNMAIEHRLMHAETLAYLIHQLPITSKIIPPIEGAAPRQPGRRAAGQPAEPPRLIGIPSGIATLGRGIEEHRFGWDNEFGRISVHVPDFTIEAHKVSNGRFLDFVREGGYENQRYWSDADWAWKRREGIRHPHYWREQDGEWTYCGMFAEVPLPLDAPVYVSHAEASAFARWEGRALPTEAQFHRAAYATPDGGEREYPWGEEPPARAHGNFDLRLWDPTPIGAHPKGDSAFGVSELVGNGWEWTSTLFGPFPGFRPHPLYEGYSANFFDGEHFVQKGGSPRTAACMLRRSFRNWFQPHYPYVYASFRLVAEV